MERKITLSLGLVALVLLSMTIALWSPWVLSNSAIDSPAIASRDEEQTGSDQLGGQRVRLAREIARAALDRQRFSLLHGRYAAARARDRRDQDEDEPAGHTVEEPLRVEGSRKSAARPTGAAPDAPFST